MTIKWAFDIKTYTREEVREYCIQDADWQAFRLTLKGLSTRDKLSWLSVWRMGSYTKHGCLTRATEVQTDNYINALKRGGQLNLDGTIKR